MIDTKDTEIFIEKNHQGQMMLLENVLCNKYGLGEDEAKEQILKICERKQHDFIINTANILIDLAELEHLGKNKKNFCLKLIDNIVDIQYNSKRIITVNSDIVSAVKLGRSYGIKMADILCKTNLAAAFALKEDEESFDLAESATVPFIEARFAETIEALKDRKYQALANQPIFKQQDLKNVFARCSTLAFAVDGEETEKVLDYLDTFFSLVENVTDDERQIMDVRKMIDRCHSLLTVTENTVSKSISMMEDKIIKGDSSKLKEVALRIAQAPTLALTSPDVLEVVESSLQSAFKNVYKDMGSMMPAERAAEQANRIVYNLDNFSQMPSKKAATGKNFEKIITSIQTYTGSKNALTCVENNVYILDQSPEFVEYVLGELSRSQNRHNLLKAFISTPYSFLCLNNENQESFGEGTFARTYTYKKNAKDKEFDKIPDVVMNKDKLEVLREKYKLKSLELKQVISQKNAELSAAKKEKKKENKLAQETTKISAAPQKAESKEVAVADKVEQVQNPIVIEQQEKLESPAVLRKTYSAPFKKNKNNGKSNKNKQKQRREEALRKQAQQVEMKNSPEFIKKKIYKESIRISKIYHFDSMAGTVKNLIHPLYQMLEAEGYDKLSHSYKQLLNVAMQIDDFIKTGAKKRNGLFDLAALARIINEENIEKLIKSNRLNNSVIKDLNKLYFGRESGFKNTENVIKMYTPLEGFTNSTYVSGLGNYILERRKDKSVPVTSFVQVLGAVRDMVFDSQEKAEGISEKNFKNPIVKYYDLKSEFRKMFIELASACSETLNREFYTEFLNNTIPDISYINNFAGNDCIVSPDYDFGLLTEVLIVPEILRFIVDLHNNCGYQIGEDGMKAINLYQDSFNFEVKEKGVERTKNESLSDAVVIKPQEECEEGFNNPEVIDKIRKMEKLCLELSEEIGLYGRGLTIKDGEIYLFSGIDKDLFVNKKEYPYSIIEVPARFDSKFKIAIKDFWKIKEFGLPKNVNILSLNETALYPVNEGIYNRSRNSYYEQFCNYFKKEDFRNDLVKSLLNINKEKKESE